MSTAKHRTRSQWQYESQSPSLQPATRGLGYTRRPTGERRPPIFGDKAPTRQRCCMSAEISGRAAYAPEHEPEPTEGSRLRPLPAATEPAFPLEHDFEVVQSPLIGPTAVLLARAMTRLLDVHSRYAVAWLVATRESARLAEELIGRRHLPTTRASRTSSPARRPGIIDDLEDRHPTARRPRPAAVRQPSSPVQRRPLQRIELQDLEVLPDLPETFHQQSPSLTSSSSTTTTTSPASGRLPTFTTDAPLRAQRQTVLDAAHTTRPERFRRPPNAPRIPETTWINPSEETPQAI